MEFDLEAALARYPLPDTVEDQIVNRTQLARALNKTEPIISKYLDQGMPVVARGSNGQSYEFRLSECYAWKMWRDGETQRRFEASERASAQMSLLFRNDEDADPNEQVLTAAQIAEEADADYKRSRAAEARGDLVRRARMQALVDDVLTIFRNSMMSLPDYAEVEFGLEPLQVDKLQRRCDEVLVQAAVRIRKDMFETPAVVRQLRGGDPVQQEDA
ncbi:hypothetical protein RPE78_12280 [Thioclava litoralis]|uniref:Phage DNA packaging protein, Nu1 subunit of terminase n=1 Tax=Thioclava litoralis TaxID=3076557 RepID=A0ABZ1E029_9RHOB|nr:hypothetical protein RPE78_12280 [Thioclava sp. FTW29]